MKVFDGNWQAFMARTLVFGAVVFGAVKLAVADPGGPASPNDLTYSGVLRNLAGTGPLSGSVTLSFSLRRADGVNCPPVSVSTTASATGAFSVPVSTAGCPSGFFNGATVTYDVALVSPMGEAGQLTPDGGVAITPVPYARFADQVGVNNDCPAGYVRLITSSAEGFAADRVRRLCIRGPASNPQDEIVRVGTGATAFWIDRFEAVVRDRRGAVVASLAGLPANGQWYPAALEPVLSAWSQRGTPPSVSVTWFQAQELCRASGKRLPTGEEWLAAASGTVDSVSTCNVASTTGARETNSLSPCVSAWGASDMIGNVSEWTADWHGAPGNPSDAGMATSWPRALAFGDDQTFNIGGVVAETNGRSNAGLPAAAVRGGSYAGSPGANGTFVLDLRNAPSLSDSSLGFRCVIPR